MVTCMMLIRIGGNCSLEPPHATFLTINPRQTGTSQRLWRLRLATRQQFAINSGLSSRNSSTKATTSATASMHQAGNDPRVEMPGRPLHLPIRPRHGQWIPQLLRRGSIITRVTTQLREDSSKPLTPTLASLVVHTLCRPLLMRWRVLAPRLAKSANPLLNLSSQQ
jgi:hypothetical protein